tara:strand:+ start:1127 stop:1411 length:285 start_codon:yes stop_codon:yes gene_type:complete
MVFTLKFAALNNSEIFTASFSAHDNGGKCWYVFIPTHRATFVDGGGQLVGKLVSTIPRVVPTVFRRFIYNGDVIGVFLLFFGDFGDHGLTCILR